MKSKLLMFIAILIASACAVFIQAQTVIPYLPVKADFGGIPVSDLAAFSPSGGDYTLEVQGTEGVEISIAGGVYTYIPEATGKVRFAQRMGKVYVYEENVYKGILTPISKATYPDIFAAADDGAADPKTGIYAAENLIQNPGFETTKGDNLGSETDKKYAADVWLTAGCDYAGGGVRVNVDNASYSNGREGLATLLWRNDGTAVNSANVYFYQSLGAKLKPNTYYKIKIRTLSHNQKRVCDWLVGVGSTPGGYEYSKNTFQSLNTDFTVKDVEFAFQTPSEIADETYFTIGNAGNATDKTWTLIHFDRITLVEGEASMGIDGATDAKYLQGMAYAPVVNLDPNKGDYYDMTGYAVVNPDASEGNKGWTIEGSINAPANKESWLGTSPVNPYFDGGNWGATGWTTTMSQTITGLPAGKYTLNAVTRASSNVTMTLSLKSGASVKDVTCPSVGSTGGAIWDAAEDGSVEKGVNGGNGFGWGNNSVQIDLLAGEPLTIMLNSTTAGLHEWFSADQFRLSYVAVDPNPAPVAPAAPVPAATVKPVETGEYVIYHPASKKYLANSANADAPALSDYGIFTTHDAYTWDITVSADTMVLKQLSSSNYMNANAANTYGILLRAQKSNDSKWLLRDVENGYNFSSVRSTTKLVGVDGITGNYIGIYYDKDATKNPLFQFVKKDDFFAAADVAAYDAYLAELAIHNAKKDLLAEITRANTLVESHPADYTPEATAVYEAVISAAKDVFLNEAATLEEVKNVMTTISGPLNTYLMSVIEASEENPVDVTFLIKNPDFNANNANSWTGATGSAKETVYEFFNKAFNMYQKLAGLPAGYYQLKVQGLARVGIPDAGAAYKAGTEKVQSFLYGKSKAGEWNTPLMSLYAEQGTGSKDGYANSMAEANTAFKNGKYLNNVVDNIFLQESDTLTMGTKYEVNPVVKDSWTIFDNFQLIYKGNTLGTLVKELEALIQDAKAVTGVMQIAVTDALNAKITAAEAIVATEEPTKEELDGAIADLNNAIAAAESSIAAYVKLNNAIVVAGESSVAAEANVVAAIAIAQGVYDAKTVDEKGIQDALAALNGAVNATIVAKAVDGDVTALIKNPNIIQTATSVQTRPAGWENSTNSGTNGNFTKAAASATTPEVDTYLEAWNATASTINFDYNQILANVPNGIYVLSAATFTEDKSGNAVLYGNKVTAPMKTGVTGDNFFDVNNPAVNTTLTVVVTNDTLQIGIKTIGTLNGSWNGADYFKLTYLGDKATLQQELSDSIAIAGELKDGATKAMIVKAEMNKLVAAIDGGNAALVADDLSKMSDALTVLRTAITDARTSIGHCTELAALFVEANTLIATYGQTLDPTALQTVLDKNMNMYMNQTDQTDNAALVTAKAEMKAAIDAYKKIIIDDVKTVDADSVKVYVDGSSIIVEGADNYEIYTEGGLLVPANAELVPGIYIVKVAGQTIKIQVK